MSLRMHAIEELSLYYGDPDYTVDSDVRRKKSREYGVTYRRALGQKPFAASTVKCHTPPCTGCEFAKTCKERELACNIFVEWSVSRRPIPSTVRKLLPSKKWMRMLTETEHLGPVRAAYYLQTGEKTEEPQTEEMFK